MRCQARNAAGEPCKTPESLVGPDGYCPAHAPGGREKLLERAKRGGEGLRRRLQADGLVAEDLPPLRTPQDAAKRLDLIQQAVGTGRLGHREGDVMTRTVRAWLDAHKAGTQAEEIAELRAQLEALKRPRPVS